MISEVLPDAAFTGQIQKTDASIEDYADKTIPHQEFKYQNHITDVLCDAFSSNDKSATPIWQLTEEYNFGSYSKFSNN